MELLRESTVCFTGHRHILPEQIGFIRDRTADAARSLILHGYDTFIVGGALGFDTLAQLTVLGLKRELPYLRVIMAIPCEGQDALWREEDRRIYAELRRRADAEIVLLPAYTDGCMLARNRFMVDHSSVCIACYRGGKRGGTAYTVRYAVKQGVGLYNVLSDTWYRAQ